MSLDPTPGADETPPELLVRINRICDRFEAAWRAGRRPAAEDHLGDAAGRERSALLRDLVAAELECRRAIGERPAPAEYRARFPDAADAPALEAAFARVGLPSAPAATGADAGRDLLFGLLALQNDFIGRDDLLAAFNAWVADKTRTLGAILLARGAIDAPRHALLEALVGEHLKRHGGDPGRSLASLALSGSTRDSLKEVDDPDLEASLAHVGSASPAPGDATISYAVGTSTDDGRRFRVLRPHAKGGLGAVFVAMDSELNREVALKEILGRRADDPVSRQRFLVEAEITGGLEHPGIVPVYGLGTYGDGRPYYAMRFIQGDSLKEAIAAFHADPALKADPGARSLALSKLQRRFLDVCNAIGYVHSRGVLHRDIKPGNVIVGKYGETLVVDWGLAKSTGRSDPASAPWERTLVPSSASGSAETLPGSALGTPAYMSPEQAAGDLDRLGPRSDIYGLGATLYSLLTGRAPAAGGDVAAVLRSVREGTIQPPRSLEPSIDRSLEAVCLKAMAKSPEDRYPTPRALAEDVERWLADEPVTARREPLARLAGRWVRRNRTPITAAAVALIAGAIGLVAVSAVQAKAAIDLSAKNHELQTANNLITKANADLEASIALQKERFTLAMDAIKVFHGEVSRDVLLKEKRFETLRNNLLKGAADFYRRLEGLVKGRSDHDSRVALSEAYAELAELTAKIGDHRSAMAVYDLALPIRRALAAEEGAGEKAGLDVARTLIKIGNYNHYFSMSNYADCESCYNEAIDLCEKFARRSPESSAPRAAMVEALDRLGWLQSTDGAEDRANETFGRALQVAQRLADENPTAAELQTNLYMVKTNFSVHLHKNHRDPEALKLQEEALSIVKALADANPSEIEYQINLALAYGNVSGLLAHARRHSEALDLCHRSLAISKRLNEAFPTLNRIAHLLSSSCMDKGNIMVELGRPTAALAAFEEARSIREELATANPTVATPQSELAACYHQIGSLLGRMGRPAEALASFEKERSIRQKLAEGNPAADVFQRELTASHDEVAKLLFATGKSSEAVALYERALGLMESKFGLDNPETLRLRSSLASSYCNVGRFGEAIALHAENVKLSESKLGPDDPQTLRIRSHLAADTGNLGHFEREAALLEPTLKTQQLKLGPDHPDTAYSRDNLVLAYEMLGRWADAETLRRVILARRRKAEQHDDPMLADDLASLGSNLLKQAKWAQAEPVLRECLAIREKAMPDDWSRFNAMSLLGESLLGQGRHVEAEAPVVQGYEGIEASEAKLPLPSKIWLTEAAERVVRLYEAWGKPGRAASWKAKLGLADLPADVFAR